MECDEDLHLCEQVCTNTESSYQCTCNPGYTLSINRFSCNSEIAFSQLTNMYSWIALYRLPESRLMLLADSKTHENTHL